MRQHHSQGQKTSMNEHDVDCRRWIKFNFNKRERLLNAYLYDECMRRIMIAIIDAFLFSCEGKLTTDAQTSVPID